MQELSARLLDPKRVREPNAVPLLTEFQKRMAFSFAPFTFVLMGIPLAIRFHRKETSIGVLLSFGVVMAFYMMQILAMALKEKAVAYPELIVWLPNIIFQLVGFWLLWRANSKALA
jgi:lipopolysaccharide export system permease protein